jgi:hypothetical protein
MNAMTRFIVSVTFLVNTLTSCRIAQNHAATRVEMVILPDVQALTSDEEIVFACHASAKTGLYKINVGTATVTEFVQPQPGLLSKPCLSKDKQSILCIWSGKENGQYVDCIATAPVAGGILKKLFTVPLPITDFAVSPIEDRIYLLLAGDFGHSSPLVQSRLRLIELYSARLDGQDLRKETKLNAYTTSGKLSFDNTGTNLYFQIISLANTQSSGPYKYTVTSKKMTSLVPSNYAALEPEIRKNDSAKGFLTDWLTPVPGKDSTTYFLKRQYATYQVDQITKTGETLYPLPGEGRANFHSLIKSANRFNKSNDLILCEAIKGSISFLLLLERGDNRRLIPDMQPFEAAFY